MELTEADFRVLIGEKLALWRQLAGRIVNSSADAEDAVQQALINAWHRRRSLADREKLAGWIARIVVNESYNLLRRRQRERRDRLAALPPDPVNRVESRLCRLDRAIAALPELYRNTVELAVLGNFGRAEAAAALGCSVNTLYQRIHQAKLLLKRELEGREE